MADVTIKLTIGSFSVEVAGPQEYAEQKFNDLVDKYLPSPLKAASPSEASASGNVVLSDAAGKKYRPRSFSERFRTLTS